MNTHPAATSDPDERPPGPAVGDVIFPYRLVRLLGEGSAGRVFEVEHIKIGRRAAMKVLAPDHANRPGAIRRLFQEAKAVNRINHPHIVDVTDLIEASGPGGVNGIVMELLEGQSLAQAMLAQGRMPAERIVFILTQVADALAAAHGAYFIHRDLKPENIFLVRRGRQQDVVKVLDFGLAKSFGNNDGKNDGRNDGKISHNSYHTVEGTFVGTPAYTSPEQASAKSVDHRTDIYSVGVILYELLSGHLPFEGRNFGDFLVKHLTLPVPAVPAERCRTPLERTLALIAYKCLEKNPADRFGSAADIKGVLERLARGEQVEIEVRRPQEDEPPMRTRRNLILAGGVVAAAAAAVLAAATWPRTQPAKTEPPPPQSVVFSFDSRPPGAEVRQQGGDRLLGLTPFRQEFPRAQKPLTFEMRLAGHLPDVFTISANEDAFVQRHLLAAPPPVQTPISAPEPAVAEQAAQPAASFFEQRPRRVPAPQAGAAPASTLTVDPFSP